MVGDAHLSLSRACRQQWWPPPSRNSPETASSPETKRNSEEKQKQEMCVRKSTLKGRQSLDEWKKKAKTNPFPRRRRCIRRKTRRICKENKEGLLGLRRESKTDLKIKRTREEGRSRRRAAALPETARRKAEERKRGEWSKVEGVGGNEEE